MVGDRTAIILSTRCPHIGPDSDLSLHFPAHPLTQYQHDKERQERLAQTVGTDQCT